MLKIKSPKPSVFIIGSVNVAIIQKRKNRVVKENFFIAAKCCCAFCHSLYYIKYAAKWYVYDDIT